MKDNKKYADILNGDTSFKKWFKIMWENFYIQLFSVFLTITIIGGFFKELLDFEPDNYGNWFVVIMGIVGMSLIGYLGFYKFWKELKNRNGNGNS